MRHAFSTNAKTANTMPSIDPFVVLAADVDEVDAGDAAEAADVAADMAAPVSTKTCGE